MRKESQSPLGRFFGSTLTVVAIPFVCAMPPLALLPFIVEVPSPFTWRSSVGSPAAFCGLPVWPFCAPLGLRPGRPSGIPRGRSIGATRSIGLVSPSGVLKSGRRKRTTGFTFVGGAVVADKISCVPAPFPFDIPVVLLFLVAAASETMILLSSLLPRQLASTLCHSSSHRAHAFSRNGQSQTDPVRHSSSVSKYALRSMELYTSPPSLTCLPRAVHSCC